VDCFYTFKRRINLPIKSQQINKKSSLKFQRALYQFNPSKLASHKPVEGFFLILGVQLLLQSEKSLREGLRGSKCVSITQRKDGGLGERVNASAKSLAKERSGFANPS